jgi:hypothetical protein
MLVSDLQDALRIALQQRIDAGMITGSQLARQVGFRQAHISNFLRRRRGLSVEALDNILTALGLTVPDLAGSALPARSSHGSSFEDVPAVSLEIAHYPSFTASNIGDQLKFKRSFLRRLRPNLAGNRQDWDRFIIVRANADAVTAMYPRILSGATLLVDRHYNVLEPYRRRDPNIYVVRRKDGRVLIRYAELHGAQLSLRPVSQEAPMDYVPLDSGRSYSDCIIGRVCHIGSEV